DEGFAVLEQMAKSNAGREGASKIWYGQIKDMPVSDASVSALEKYLSTIVVRSGADKALAPHPPTVNRIIRSH
ncbi:hypothetical protein, partial [Shewanella xiamenensis]|uniref:hypothetical protein n=1 Tax=Shewanella xiamenensis TaxID=332186 RepID=UPI0024320782